MILPLPNNAVIDPVAISYDSVEGKVYWSDRKRDEIRRANLGEGDLGVEVIVPFGSANAGTWMSLVSVVFVEFLVRVGIHGYALQGCSGLCVPCLYIVLKSASCLLVCMPICVCRPVCPFVCLFNCLAVHMSVRLLVRLSACNSCLSNACLSARLLACPPACPPARLHACLSDCCVYVCLPVCLPA